MSSNALKKSNEILTSFDDIENLSYSIDNKLIQYKLSLGVTEDLDKIVLFEEKLILDRDINFEILCLILNSKSSYDVCFTSVKTSFDENNNVNIKEKNYIYSRHAILNYYNKTYACN